MTLGQGTRVRMSEDLKKRLRISSRAHLKEFGKCVGTVQGLTDYNNCKPGEPGYDAEKLGPEVDVRWEPHNLRYAYDPALLEVVEGE